MTEQLTISEASRHLELSVRRVRELCDQGRLEVERTPLGRLISAASVDALKKEREAAR